MLDLTRRRAEAQVQHPPPGADDWQPALLRVPTAVRSEGVRLWQWLGGRRLTVLVLLGVFLALQFLIPARLVIRGMGAVGRPSVAVGILLGFLWLVSAIRPHRLPGGRQPVRWAVGIFVAVQLTGYVVGFDRLPTHGQASGADRWLIFVVAFAGVTLSVADGMRTRRDLDRLLRILVGFASLMSVVGVLQFFRIVDLTRYIRIPGLGLNTDLIGVSARGDGDFLRVMGTANHYIEYGVVLALALPIALHYVLFSPRGWTKVWRVLALVVIALGIPLSISRSAIVTLVVVMLLLGTIWTSRQRYNAAVLGVLGVAAFHLLNPGVLGTIRSLFTNAENDPSITARIERTAIVMRLWEERPVLGWGSGMVTPEEFLLLDNQVYMFLLAGGIVGLAGFVVFLAVPYFVGRSVRLHGYDEETRHLGHTLAVTMPSAFVVSGTFDTFSFATFVALLVVLIGATGALWRLDRQMRASDPPPAVTSGRIVAVPITADVRNRITQAWEAHARLAPVRRSGR